MKSLTQLTSEKVMQGGPIPVEDLMRVPNNVLSLLRIHVNRGLETNWTCGYYISGNKIRATLHQNSETIVIYVERVATIPSDWDMNSGWKRFPIFENSAGRWLFENISVCQTYSMPFRNVYAYSSDIYCEKANI